MVSTIHSSDSVYLVANSMGNALNFTRTIVDGTEWSPYGRYNYISSTWNLHIYMYAFYYNDIVLYFKHKYIIIHSVYYMPIPLALNHHLYNIKIII